MHQRIQLSARAAAQLMTRRYVWLGLSLSVLGYGLLAAVFIGIESGLDLFRAVPTASVSDAAGFFWLAGVSAPLFALLSRDLSWGRSPRELEARRANRRLRPRADSHAEMRVREEELDELIEASYKGWLLRLALAELGSVFGVVAALIAGQIELMILPICAHLAAAAAYYPSPSRLFRSLGFRSGGAREPGPMRER